MTYEDFKRQNILIAQKLQTIADRTVNMAWANSAHPKNLEFLELMRAQDHLIRAADKLLQAYSDSQHDD